ncbi:MAG: hypothetical protein ACYS4W_05680 [Planctomycetota bacterium]|jgi:hypothetical protein
MVQIPFPEGYKPKKQKKTQEDKDYSVPPSLNKKELEKPFSGVKKKHPAQQFFEDIVWGDVKAPTKFDKYIVTGKIVEAEVYERTLIAQLAKALTYICRQARRWYEEEIVDDIAEWYKRWDQHPFTSRLAAIEKPYKDADYALTYMNMTAFRDNLRDRYKEMFRVADQCDRERSDCRGDLPTAPIRKFKAAAAEFYEVVNAVCIKANVELDKLTRPASDTKAEQNIIGLAERAARAEQQAQAEAKARNEAEQRAKAETEARARAEKQATTEAEEKARLYAEQITRAEAYIKKGQEVWEFGFEGKPASVDAKLKGLVLIEYLLLHKNKEYTPLELLKAVGQREKGETEPEKIYTDADIEKIKEAIKGLKSIVRSSTNLEEKERLEQEIEKAEDGLRKARNCKGKSRKFSEKYTKSVSRNLETVLKKIAPQNVELYNHLDTFLNRGEICCYKPDKEVFWEIS